MSALPASEVLVLWSSDFFLVFPLKLVFPCSVVHVCVHFWMPRSSCAYTYMYMCFYLYLCMYMSIFDVYTHLLMNIYIYFELICIYMNLQICKFIHIGISKYSSDLSLRLRIFIHMYTIIHICIDIYIYRYVYQYTFIYMHIYTGVYVHAYVCTYICTHI